MKLLLTRKKQVKDSTIGVITLMDKFVCYTLEDVVRQIPNKPVATWKQAGITAIPTGVYNVIIDFSNRFQKDMLHILNVDGFEGVRIHAGNTAEDTEGCILVGMDWTGINMVGHSRNALALLTTQIKAALNAGQTVTLEVH